jgi:arsenate reductase
MSAAYNVLFICTDNSARSILAESLVNDWGQGRFKGYSAGSFPKGEVHPCAIELLSRFSLPRGNLCSKSWDQFAKPGAAKMDFVITLCDQAAREPYPIWPGQPIIAHWPVIDPAAIAGGKAMQALAFQHVFAVIVRRIIPFLDVRLLLDRQTTEARVREIGRIGSHRDGVNHYNPTDNTARDASGLMRRANVAR